MARDTTEFCSAQQLPTCAMQKPTLALYESSTQIAEKEDCLNGSLAPSGRLVSQISSLKNETTSILVCVTPSWWLLENGR